MDFNQSWVIDAIWEPSFVDAVKGHISRSMSPEVKLIDWLKMLKWPYLKRLNPIGNKLALLIQYETLCMFVWQKVIYKGQRSSEVKL